MLLIVDTTDELLHSYQAIATLTSFAWFQINLHNLYIQPLYLYTISTLLYNFYIKPLFSIQHIYLYTTSISLYNLNNLYTTPMPLYNLYTSINNIYT